MRNTGFVDPILLCVMLEMGVGGVVFQWQIGGGAGMMMA
jgi:hypothetical protein